MARWKEVVALLALTLVVVAGGQTLPPPCESNVYCHGELLHTVQMASIYHDSKTFVDMKMKSPPEETLKSFNDFMQRTGRSPKKWQLELFLNETFEPAGSEFETWDPSDWRDRPPFLQKVYDADLREWGNKLNGLWKFLGRKMKADIKDNQELYSIIYVPHPVIVPGGRFREFYYWDSYWIVRGLLLSEMDTTVKGMLENFLTIVESYGFIPNGGRIYYAMRSQPPLLIPMVKSYVDKTHDMEFLKNSVATMEKEFQYWMTNHTVQVRKDQKTYTLARYKDSSSGPRPESYKEDYNFARGFKTEQEKEDFYSELKAGAESGWDFSSRWFLSEGTNAGNLTHLKTRFIVPVDLNAIIYGNAEILSDFYRQLGNYEKTVKYSLIAKEWLEAVTAVLWHDDVGAWLDYDILNEKKRDYFYPTNISPLWTGCFDKQHREKYVNKILKYLDKNQVMLYHGGVPTSFERTGEQWDYPNAWPPLQYIMIMGLDNTGDIYAQELAFEMTERWVRSNFIAFNDSNAMYEKYDATVSGGHGGGGEYDVQLGFGWSNGVIMELLDKYGDRLTVDDRLFLPPDLPPTSKGRPTAAASSFGSVVAVTAAIILSMAIGCFG